MPSAEPAGSANRSSEEGPPHMTRIRIRWTAARVLVSHAHRSGRDARTLCGMPEIRERDGWPPLRRCLVCTPLAEELVGPPMGR